MSDSIIDIFADHTPVPDERNDALKGELEVLRVQLQPMVASAPSKDTDMLYPDMEVWCRTWKTLTVSDFSIDIGPHIHTNFTQSHIELAHQVDDARA
jgi:hypothetical protein